ncbi:hypothetical protein GJ744_004103 [Endocarpon pusillum]|uniref:SH3 domain-containing protein n=1 Tax=Endocarpon pusillum TaxID=364733 RepID=A0A8H7ALS4_9EURO|nr:hypothetical protein GJ744_004103 [Endocarpon pusillum]
MATVPFKVKAVYEYSSPHDDDLSFPQGQIITVTEEEDNDWYSGEYADSTGRKHQGIFPRNFVEKYEPEIPSRPIRPSRTKKDAEIPAPAPTPVAATTQGASVGVPAAQGREDSQKRPDEVSSPRSGSSASAFPTQQPARQVSSTTAYKASEPPQTKPANKDVPTESSERPSGGSFRDRIAAFNKPAAPPVAPFKPGGQGASNTIGFIKKPFVAPPPSKNAYIPPPREPPPAKVYRREEDPGLNETAEDSEASMPLPGERAEVGGDDRPKPTSLKDRIALLQKQQLEQAARHAEAAQKKEKPKRPAKKRTESQEPNETSDAVADADVEGSDIPETIGKKSVDFADDESEPLDRQGSRQPFSAAHVSTPPPPSRELMSDTNDADNSAAGDTEEADDTSTSREDNRETGKRAILTTTQDELVSEAVDAEASDEEGQEEQDVDPEIKRRMEIRERMAKMSGGMGLMGMFGPPGGMPTPGKKARASGEGERDVSGTQLEPEAVERAPPVPVPGMFNVKNPEPKPIPTEEDSSADEGTRHTHARQQAYEIEHSDEGIVESPKPPPRSSTDRAPPPLPQARAVPPPPPRQSRTPPPTTPAERPVPGVPSSLPQGRGAPPPPPRTSMPLSPGELSDDEISTHESPTSQHNIAEETSRPQSRDVQPPFTAPPVPTGRPEGESSLPSQTSGTPSLEKEKRTSRGLPPLPPSSPITGSAQQFRAPPPPPPGQPPSRKSTSQSRHITVTTQQGGADASEGEVTEYDGDYDTDIASSAKHKDALKSHARDSSLDDDTIVDQVASKQSASPPGRGPPPLPNVSAPRDVPPPPPPIHSGKQSRKSSDMPRAAPPPVPPPKEALQADDENAYDPYQHYAPEHDIASPTSSQPFSPVTKPPEPDVDDDDDDLYDASPRSARAPPLQPAQGPPPSMPIQPPHAQQNIPRQSLDILRSQTAARRSMEVPRPSSEHGFMATDIDLAPSSQWYAQTPDVPPPSLQSRNDILYEIESSTSSRRGGKSTISKDIYILYMDYSQTVITANFDASDPSSVVLEQRHERPPPPPRQDQLESASSQFGTRIASSVPSKASITVGDGTAHALILHLLGPLSPNVLQPVGTRAYGAPVYSNLANASTQQFDEIRPGDIVTFRNAKFAGHKGGLHTKYSMEVGKPDHVAVVADWDGTKKKIRVWEQKGKDGKEKDGAKGAKVREESYRVSDLKSGEVRVWRVIGRGWVGWDGGQK